MNSNLNSAAISGFSSLLYVNFIIKKKYRVDAIAKEMRVATDTLYRYVRGENIMPPDRVIDLVAATKDIEYLEFFCEPCGYLPVNIPLVKVGKKPIERTEIELSILTGRALMAIEKAFEDQQVNKTEFKAINQVLLRLQEKAAELKEKVKVEVR